MRQSDEKRAALLESMADHVLAHGVGMASLRPLAAAAGTSDRMLLYYFPDKDAILAAVFGRIAGRFVDLLAVAALPAAPCPAAELRPALWRLVRAPAFRPFIRVYLELCVAAARGEQPHATIAGQLAQGFLGWVGSRLEVQDEVERLPQAALIVAAVDGLWLLDAVGLGAIADRAGSL
jgi:AcrR family transcriptional regulator